MRVGTQHFTFLGLSLVLVACGAHDGSRVLPTSDAGQPVAAQGSGMGSQPSTGIVMASSVGAPPAGFKPRFRAEPQPGEDGVIRGDSPIDVKFDLCGSTPDGDKTLFYLYDWDFDNVADAVESGNECSKEHEYHLARNATAGADIATNVCIVNGDPRSRERSGMFFACRTYRVSLATPPAQANSCGGINGTTPVGSYAVNSGPYWGSDPPTFTCVEACALLFGGSSSQYACSTQSGSVDHNANMDGWGESCFVDTECHKVNTHYDCGSGGCSESAYVSDHGCSGVNYCFK